MQIAASSGDDVTTSPSAATPAESALDGLPDDIPASRRTAGKLVIAIASLLLLSAFAVQTLFALGVTSFGYENWRFVLYAYLVWGVALGVGQILIRGEAGLRALFLLPAVLFTVAM